MTPSKETIIKNVEVESASGCWNWVRAKSWDGRGVMRIGTRSAVMVSRIVYELWTGQKPGKMNVCHKCDNPSCVNPEHLFLGTHKQNSQDCINKGRWWSDNRKKSMLRIPDEVIAMVKASVGPEIEVAKTIGCSRSCVNRIRSGKFRNSVPLHEQK